MNKRGFVWIIVLIYIACLIFDFFVFGKPMSIWLTEKATNKTIMTPVMSPIVNSTNISQIMSISRIIELAKNLTGLGL